MRIRGLVKGLVMVGTAGLILNEIEKFKRKIDELKGLVSPRRPPYAYQRITRPINLQTKELPSYLLDSREDAHKLLDALTRLDDNFGFVSLSHVHGLMGLPTSSGDEKFGWFNLSHMNTEGWVTQSKDGWKVTFPPMAHL